MHCSPPHSWAAAPVSGHCRVFQDPHPGPHGHCQCHSPAHIPAGHPQGSDTEGHGTSAAGADLTESSTTWAGCCSAIHGPVQPKPPTGLSFIQLLDVAPMDECPDSGIHRFPCLLGCLSHPAPLLAPFCMDRCLSLLFKCSWIKAQKGRNWKVAGFPRYLRLHCEHWQKYLFLDLKVGSLACTSSQIISLSSALLSVTVGQTNWFLLSWSKPFKSNHNR